MLAILFTIVFLKTLSRNDALPTSSFKFTPDFFDILHSIECTEAKLKVMKDSLLGFFRIQCTVGVLSSSLSLYKICLITLSNQLLAES